MSDCHSDGAEPFNVQNKSYDLFWSTSAILCHNYSVCVWMFVIAAVYCYCCFFAFNLTIITFWLVHVVRVTHTFCVVLHKYTCLTYSTNNNAITQPEKKVERKKCYFFSVLLEAATKSQWLRIKSQQKCTSEYI